MKELTDIINDIFGEQSKSFTRDDLIKVANVYSSQFKLVKTTCGKNIEFDDIDYALLKQQPVFFNNRRKTVSALWFSKEGKRIVAPIAKLLLNAEGRCIIRYKDNNPLNLKRNNLSQTSLLKGRVKIV